MITKAVAEAAMGLVRAGTAASWTPMSLVKEPKSTMTSAVCHRVALDPAPAGCAQIQSAHH